MILVGLAIMAGPGRAVAQNRPMGTDVSSYQGGGIDWTNVRNDGVFFAWTKATEGVDYEDADFAINETNAKAAGVFIGAYHFAHYDLTNGAVAEANYFWAFAKNYIKNDTWSLMPMLDVEVTPTNGSTAAIVSAWVNTWCSNVVALGASNGLALHPVIYTGTSFAGTWLNSSVTQWSAWLAAYPDGTPGDYGSPTPQTSNPGNWSPWSTWNIWQYGDTNWSGGDSDVFNGTTNQFLQLFLVGSTNAPRITTNPVTITVAQGAEAGFSVSVTGGTPLYYHWQFDGANVASVTNFNTNSLFYPITNAQSTNAGNYAVQVSNAYGSSLSTVAFLSVTAPLSNTTGSVIAPAGLVNWWPANGNAIDIVNNNNGLPANGFFYAPGKSGLAFHFDGSTSYLTMTNSPADVAVPWTACMWVYRQQTPQTSAALLSDGTYTLKLEQYENTHEVGLTQLSVADWIFTNSSYTVPLQTWTHLAFVASGSGASALTTLYVNGAQQGIINTNLPLGRLTMGATDVSGIGYVDYLEGSMDEVMIFNKALTAAQIQAIYNAGSAGLVQAPQFLGISAGANGNLTFSLEGLTGSKNFTVYSSSNLNNWTILSTLSAAAGSNQFTISPTNAATFYRAVQP